LKNIFSFNGAFWIAERLHKQSIVPYEVFDI